jgi:hypothetical protein
MSEYPCVLCSFSSLEAHTFETLSTSFSTAIFRWKAIHCWSCLGRVLLKPSQNCAFFLVVIPLWVWWTEDQTKSDAIKPKRTLLEG